MVFYSIVQYTTVSGVSRLQSEYRLATFRFWRHRKIVVLSFIIRQVEYLCIHFGEYPPVFGTAYWRVSLDICHLKNDLYPRTPGPVKQDKDSLRGRKKILHPDEPSATTGIPRRNQPCHYVITSLSSLSSLSSPISGCIRVGRITG